MPVKLTRYTDYALRILIYLGTHEGVVPTRTIAEAYGISIHHVTKAAKQLTEMGLVRAQRGKHGGIQLEKRPESIRLGWVVRRTEPGLDLVECFDVSNSTCPLTPACGLKGALKEAQDAFLGALDDVTLADILGNRARLRKLLGSGAG